MPLERLVTPGTTDVRGRSEGDPSGPRKSRHDFWGVVLDAPDAPALARFYAGLLGCEASR